MSKITGLKSIEIYQEALRLSQLTFSIVHNEKLKREYFLIDQMKRASLSVAANIAEGYGRNTKRDFSQFLSVSLGSVNEMRTYLDFIELHFHLDIGFLKERYEVLCRRIHSFRAYLLKSS